jgi:Bacterial alpha-L-rhamnosidase 6 hairpin glycosidase domain
MKASLPLLLLLALFVPRAGAAEPKATPQVRDDADGIRLTSGYIDVTLSPDHPALLSLAVDSIGGGRLLKNVLSAGTGATSSFHATRLAPPNGVSVAYVRGDAPAGSAPEWTLAADGRGIRATALWTGDTRSEPLTLTFDTHRCYATLLGLFDKNGDIRLPAVLHLPGFGSLRMEEAGTHEISVGYAAGPGWVKVTFPAATAADPRREFAFSVAAICPEIPAAQTDGRLDGFRRNWLNIFQLNPTRRVLSNNTSSDTCGFCYYEYADIARITPPLAGDLRALDMIRQSLDRVLSGMKTYGMPGYGDFPEATSDTYPSLLIAACDYVEGRPDGAWLTANFPALWTMVETMLATDRDGDGLFKYVASGNSGSWNEGQPKVRPSNWWDTVGFGHEDAYSNALAYRALQGMTRMAAAAGRPGDAKRCEAAATRLHDAYFPAFYVPRSGRLAGWRSADGALHDYSFLFVNSIAVLYGLVPEDKEAAIMDRLWEDLKAAGYTNFRMGLPGNLVPVARKDYAHKDPRYGGGVREDNSDGFQIYENGGATACFAYFTIAAFNHVGQHDRADQILFPVLAAFNAREFEGVGAGARTNDWRKWDGTAEGYEGFLTDNYYALLAVPER